MTIGVCFLTHRQRRFCYAQRPAHRFSAVQNTGAPSEWVEVKPDNAAYLVDE
jgi:hypothetical protein